MEKALKIVTKVKQARNLKTLDEAVQAVVSRDPCAARSVPAQRQDGKGKRWLYECRFCKSKVAEIIPHLAVCGEMRMRMRAVFWVDDWQMSTNDEAMADWLMKTLFERFDGHDVSPDTFLGLQIDYDRAKGTLNMHQRNYIEELFRTYQLEACNPTATPWSRTLTSLLRTGLQPLTSPGAFATRSWWTASSTWRSGHGQSLGSCARSLPST